MGLSAVGDGSIPTERNDRYAIRGDAKVRQTHFYGLRAFFRNIPIEIATTVIVAVAFDNDLDTGITRQPLSLGLECETRSPPELHVGIGKEDPITSDGAEILARLAHAGRRRRL